MFQRPMSLRILMIQVPLLTFTVNAANKPLGRLLDLTESVSLPNDNNYNGGDYHMTHASYLRKISTSQLKEAENSHNSNSSFSELDWKILINETIKFNNENDQSYRPQSYNQMLQDHHNYYKKQKRRTEGGRYGILSESQMAKFRDVDDEKAEPRFMMIDGNDGSSASSELAADADLDIGLGEMELPNLECDSSQDGGDIRSMDLEQFYRTWFTFWKKKFALRFWLCIFGGSTVCGGITSIWAGTHGLDAGQSVVAGFSASIVVFGLLAAGVGILFLLQNSWNNAQKCGRWSRVFDIFVGILYLSFVGTMAGVTYQGVKWCYNRGDRNDGPSMGDPDIGGDLEDLPDIEETVEVLNVDEMMNNLTEIENDLLSFLEESDMDPSVWGYSIGAIVGIITGVVMYIVICEGGENNIEQR